MSVKISKMQILDPSYWGKLTREAHLGWMGMQDPQWISKFIDRVYEVNYGADNIVSFIDRFPTRYMDDDTPFRWALQGSEERNIPLVKATTTASTSASQITNSDRAGLGFGVFYMWFAEDFFSATSVMVGHHPEKYSLRVTKDAIQIGEYFVYEVQLVTGDSTKFIDYEEVAAGTLWSEEYGLIEQEFSVRGNDVKHASHFIMENTFSMISKNYEVPGNMIRKGKVAPLAFKFTDQTGKEHTSWISKLEWDFLVQFRRDKARLLLGGKSTKTAEGGYALKGESGNTIKAGFGLYEQMEGGNLLFYNDFSLKALTDFAMDISVGKVAEDKRQLVLSTGEYGAYQLHKALAERGGEIAWLRSDHNLARLGDGKMKLAEGQFVEYEFVNGIKFKLMIDPMKDDPIRNKIRDPRGGFASSYIYDIWDFGTTNGKPNIQRVAVKGDEEIYAFVPGMRDGFSNYNNLSSPRAVSSLKDGYSVRKMYQGAIQVNNILKTGRIIPSILR